MQIARMELMERGELEFQQEKLQEKDITAKEMEAHLLLERQLAEEKRKTPVSYTHLTLPTILRV